MLHNYISSTVQDENSWELNDRKYSVVTIFRRQYKKSNEQKFPAAVMHVYGNKKKPVYLPCTDQYSGNKRRYINSLVKKVYL